MSTEGAPPCELQEAGKEDHPHPTAPAEAVINHTCKMATTCTTPHPYQELPDKSHPSHWSWGHQMRGSHEVYTAVCTQ